MIALGFAVSRYSSLGFFPINEARLHGENRFEPGFKFAPLSDDLIGAQSDTLDFGCKLAAHFFDSLVFLARVNPFGHS